VECAGVSADSHFSDGLAEDGDSQCYGVEYFSRQACRRGKVDDAEDENSGGVKNSEGPNGEEEELSQGNLAED